MSDPDSCELKRPHARLDWTRSGPVSLRAGDIYFSAEDGLAESRAVFVEVAGFPDRFVADDVTIVGELGFGTGLNFLALWDVFRRTAPKEARLHVVTVEGFPLHHQDAARALAAFPELDELAQALIKVWPSPHKGPHRLVFDRGRVMLTVFHDRVEQALEQMQFLANAWFLDGFAPARNRDMWTPSLFEQLARLSSPGCRAVTFTAAGAVRRGLAAAGFCVHVRPGFGRKRERLEAIFEGEAIPPGDSPFPMTAPQDGPVAVVGGGIAAASLCHALSLRGRTVQVYARGGWGKGASGAPGGLLTPRLEAADRPHNRALLAAFDYARRLYDGRPGFKGSGVVRQAKIDIDKDRLRVLATRLDSGFGWRKDGMLMARAGQFEPGRLVRSLSADVPVNTHTVRQIMRTGSGWALLGNAGAVLGECAVLILAGGWEGVSLLDTDRMPLAPTAGRVGLFDTDRKSWAKCMIAGAGSGYQRPIACR